MTYSYTYDPDAWHPVLAGGVAGSIAAIVAAVVSLPLRSPDGAVVNSLTVVVTSIVVGLVAGGLWRRLRASRTAPRTFAWTMVGGFFVTLAAIALVDLTAMPSLMPYAGPLTAIVFITLGFFTPMLSRVTAPAWIALVPIVVALAIGIGLLGRGAEVTDGDAVDVFGTTLSAATEETALPAD